MHEVSLVHALFDQADRAVRSHAPRDVRLVRVRIGAMSGVEPELFVTAFDGVRTERGYAAAELEVVHAPGVDLILERIELEVPVKSNVEVPDV
jgi:hydrogenase nickel incorporation protein HypA/HybF